MGESFHIRVATASDAEALPGVQSSAGALFRTMPDLAWIADEPIEPPAHYLPMIARGDEWVAQDARCGIEGCLFGEVVEVAFHVLDLAGALEAQQQKLGRRVLVAAAAAARSRGLAALT